MAQCRGGLPSMFVVLGLNPSNIKIKSIVVPQILLGTTMTREDLLKLHTRPPSEFPIQWVWNEA